MLKKEIKKLRGFFLNLVLIWGAFLLYKTLPYYQNFLRYETYATMFYLASAYTFLAALYYTFIPLKNIKTTKGELIFSLLHKAIKLKVKEIERNEKIAFLFVLVKIFFLPLMLNFFFSNLQAFLTKIPSLTFSHLFSFYGFNTMIFPFVLIIIFLLDTLWFAFGYAFESGKLKNTIRSVEPTFFGWAVALICYPPFNSFATSGINLFGLTLGLNWYANDYVSFFDNVAITVIFRILILILLSIYVSATFALGTKCSNLTNRGIVSHGPYKFIRHPAYISKNLAWWLTIIPVASIPAILSMSAWSFIYHMRSVTEERHLSKDMDYVEYKKKVKWKYVPGIY